MLFFHLALATLLGSAYAAPLLPEIESPLKSRALPTPVSAATARTYLASLTVATRVTSPAYDRDLFPLWITISGQCNTRETVLQRDGTNVVASSTCAATSGSWYCQYTGNTYTAASDLDIDHLVPLSNAWQSGAWAWTTAERQQFANDLTRPQLIAVHDATNQAKGDKSPDVWMPPRSAYYCTYVRAWVTVKHYYELTVTSAERAALQGYLADC